MDAVASITTNPVEAYIIRGRLEVEGVPAVVLFEHHIWAKWSLSYALGGVRVLVPREKIELASEIISRINSGEYETDLLQDQKQSFVECPKCKSENTVAQKWVWKTALVLLFIAVFVMPYTNHLYKCEKCRYSWTAHARRPYPLLSMLVAILLLAMMFGLLYVVAAVVFSWRVSWV
jgi:ribosomal protein L37AE/L43A